MINNPHQEARLRGAFIATDDDGNPCHIALFDGAASDGYHSSYHARDVSWIVWTRGMRIVMASRYAGRNRARAVREFHDMRHDNRLTSLAPTDPLGHAGITWRSWSRLLREGQQR